MTFLRFVLLSFLTFKVWAGKKCEELFHEPKNPTRINLWQAADKKGQGQWNIVRDTAGREWVTGISHLGRGTSEFYIRTPESLTQDAQFLILTKFFAEKGLSELPPTKVGYTLHFDSSSTGSGKENKQHFHILLANRLSGVPTGRVRANILIENPSDIVLDKKDNALEAGLLPAQTTIFEDYLKFLMAGYAKKLKLNPTFLKKLEEISLSLKERSLLFAHTEEGSVEYWAPYNQIRVAHDQKTSAFIDSIRKPQGSLVIPEHYNFKGGAILVHSKSKDEKLPLEMLTGFSIPRTKGLTIEVGRFFVDDDLASPEAASQIMALLFNVISHNSKIDQVVIEADEIRKTYFQRFGFEKILHERVNSKNEKEYILLGDAKKIAAQIEKRLVQRLALKPSVEGPFTIERELTPAVKRSSVLDPKNFKGHPLWAGDTDTLNEFLANLFLVSKSGPITSELRQVFKHDLVSKLPLISTLPPGSAEAIIQSALNKNQSSQPFDTQDLTLEVKKRMSPEQRQKHFPLDGFFEGIKSFDLDHKRRNKKFLLDLWKYLRSYPAMIPWRYLYGDQGLYEFLHIAFNHKKMPLTEALSRAYKNKEFGEHTKWVKLRTYPPPHFFSYWEYLNRREPKLSVEEIKRRLKNVPVLKDSLTEGELNELATQIRNENPKNLATILRDTFGGFLVRHPQFEGKFEDLARELSKPDYYSIHPGWEKIHELYREDWEEYLVNLAESFHFRRMDQNSLQRNLNITLTSNHYTKAEAKELVRLIKVARSNESLIKEYRRLRDQVVRRVLREEGIVWPD